MKLLRLLLRVQMNFQVIESKLCDINNILKGNSKLNLPPKNDNSLTKNRKAMQIKGINENGEKLSDKYISESIAKPTDIYNKLIPLSNLNMDSRSNGIHDKSNGINDEASKLNKLTAFDTKNDNISSNQQDPSHILNKNTTNTNFGKVLEEPTVKSKTETSKSNSTRIQSGTLKSSGQEALEKLLDVDNEEDEFDFQNHQPLSLKNVINFDYDNVSNFASPIKSISEEETSSLEDLNFRIQNQPIIIGSKKFGGDKKILIMDILPKEFKEPLIYNQINPNYEVKGQGQSQGQVRELIESELPMTEEKEKYSSIYDVTRSSQDSFAKDFPLHLQSIKSIKSNKSIEPIQKNIATLSFSSMQDFSVLYRVYNKIIN